MSSTYSYVTYIRSTPARIWSAITTPEFMRQYWFGQQFETDWKQGSPIKLMNKDGSAAVSGKIMECAPQKRLVMTWHDTRKDEPPTRCVIDLEETKGAVKVSIHHSSEADNSQVIVSVSGGWPLVLSNLKSLLETGKLTFSEGNDTPPKCD
jgi:uncharacterized protein YndB with AHSA1/START domain